ncbi:MAG: four helix bundle suffix domain-containing protein [Nitrospirota bacterium]
MSKVFTAFYMHSLIGLIGQIMHIKNEKPNLIPPHGVYRQLRQLEKQFLKEGGFTERLYQARQEAKNNK